MSTETIEIRVDSEAARSYAKASDDQRRKLDLLLSIRIQEVTRSGLDLESVMSDIARRAQERGLTETELTKLLEDD